MPHCAANAAYCATLNISIQGAAQLAAYAPDDVPPDGLLVHNDTHVAYLYDTYRFVLCIHIRHVFAQLSMPDSPLTLSLSVFAGQCGLVPLRPGLSRRAGCAAVACSQSLAGGPVPPALDSAVP